MDKKRGHYFEGGKGKPIVNDDVKPKGKPRKQIELESEKRARQEKLDREKLRLKREIRREHLSGHVSEDYEVEEKWDRESKLVVYSILGFKSLLVTFAMFEIYHAIVYKTFFLF